MTRAASGAETRRLELARLRDTWSEAAEGAAADLSPDRPQRQNILRLMYEVYYVSGALVWRRTGELRRVLEGAGCTCPRNHTLRWYRSTLADDPSILLSYDWPDPEVVRDMAGGGPL